MFKHVLYVDTETMSLIDLEEHGPYVYARDPSTRMLLLMYALDDADITQIDLTDGGVVPPDFIQLLQDPATLKVARNATFDYLIMTCVQGYTTPIDQWADSAAASYAHGFPGSLDKAGQTIGLPTDKAKLKEGKSLLRVFSQPQPDSRKVHRIVPPEVRAAFNLPHAHWDKYTPAAREAYGIPWWVQPGFHNRLTHPEEWESFKEYGWRDVEADREICRLTPGWNYPTLTAGGLATATDVAMEELRLWQLDSTFNSRGFRIDTSLVNAEIDGAAYGKQLINEQIARITKGYVTKATQRTEFLTFVELTYGIALEDLQADTLSKWMESGRLSEEAYRLFELRLIGNKASVSKYTRIEQWTCDDGRLRGSLQYNGAARTRRYAGRGPQYQNLPSRMDEELLGMVPDYITSSIEGTAPWFYGDELVALSAAAIRGTILASAGHVLQVADWSNIEGRITAWLCGAEWKLEAFRAFDRGEGPDLYKVAAGKMTGQDPYKVSKALRDGMGKPAELLLGYEGGVNALRKMLKNKRMHDKWDEISAAVPKEYITQAHHNFGSWGHKRTLLDRDEWVACETVKLAWRANIPELAAKVYRNSIEDARRKDAPQPGLWQAVAEAAELAVRHPGTVFTAGQYLKYRVSKFGGRTYLLCRLPSSRVLCYDSPRLEKTGVSYMGMDQQTKQWVRRSFYGGFGLENASQAIAGDILKASLPKFTDAGFKVLLSVHDEPICEDYDRGPVRNAERLAEMKHIMEEPPSWAAGLPLAASGYTDVRYRK